MIRIYRILLRFYPKSFRSCFGEEILATLSQVEAERATGGLARRIVSSSLEVAALLAGIFVERFCVRRSGVAWRHVGSGSPSTVHAPASGAIAEAEATVRFHLARTIDCIAHHRFEGARFHAREEAAARQRLSTLQHPSS